MVTHIVNHVGGTGCMQDGVPRQLVFALFANARGPTYNLPKSNAIHIHIGLLKLILVFLMSH